MVKPVLLSVTFCIVALGSSLQARADQVQANDEANQRKQFELQAVMSDRGQLSRREVDPGAVGRSISVKPNPQANQAPVIAAKPPGTPEPMPTVDDPKLIEYNVDWSTWIGRMADRWFYQLRRSEYQMGIQFHTPRPALIQFTCYADGTIGNIALRQSSGIAAYDQLQMQSLMQITPLPQFPSGSRRRTLTLVQGWESHPKQAGEQDYQPGSFGRGFPQEKVRKWVAGKQ